jgi:hypothetical protein
MDRHTGYFLLGAAVLTIGGATAYRYYYDYFLLMPGIGTVQEVELREHLIMSLAIGSGLFICMAGGYCLFQAVRQSRLRTVMGVTLVTLLVAMSAFIPCSLMFVAQLFWPDVYQGERGWDFVIALFVTSPLVIGLWVIFIISLLLYRYLHAKAGA